MGRPVKLLSILAVVVLGAMATGCGDDGGGGASTSESSTTTVASEPVVLEELATTAPANAPGQELHLTRVTIQPDGATPVHYHDGTQIANVVEGTLTYTIVSGTVRVTRADGTVEEFTGPDEITLEPGDSLTETRDLIHAGANDGDEPLVILTALLIAEGAPLSTPVEE